MILFILSSARSWESKAINLQKLCSLLKLEEGDPVTLIDLGEGIFLSPKISVLPKLVAQIEDLCQKHDISLTELINGVAAMRKQ